MGQVTMQSVDIDDPLAGAFVPETREQLAQFEEPGGFVTLQDGRSVSVRRHRDALNHMRRRETGGVVSWGLRMGNWRAYEPLLRADDERQGAVLDRLSRQAATDPSAGTVTLVTTDPLDLIALGDMFDALRHRFWTAGDRGRARKIAVYIGALRVRASELSEDLRA